MSDATRHPSATPGGALLLPYPTFSAAEMSRRREAVAAVLGEAETEPLVVYGANRAGSGVQWLTRWMVTREAAAVHTPSQVDALQSLI